MKLQTKPLMTKAITSGLIAGAGDLTCQFIVQQRTYSLQIGSSSTTTDESSTVHDLEKFHFEPDFIRLCRFTFLGFALIAPVVHVSIKECKEW